jgi:hypothetical protein
MGYRRRHTDDDTGLISEIFDLAMRWPPAGLIAAALFATAGFVARTFIRSDLTGSLGGEAVALAFFVFAGFSLLAFFVGGVFWTVRRMNGAVRDRLPDPSASGGAGQPAGTVPRPAPACPRCGVTMVRRAARDGAHAGRPFYGCGNFPRCRAVRPIA